MAGTGPQIEWYLARDGAQHGPLSDVEMRAFVQLGHLRPGDLVWRAGFADWRPGQQVTAELSEPVAPAAPPAAPAMQAGGTGGVATTTAATTGASANQGRAAEPTANRTSASSPGQAAARHAEQQAARDPAQYGTPRGAAPGAAEPATAVRASVSSSPGQPGQAWPEPTARPVTQPKAGSLQAALRGPLQARRQPVPAGQPLGQPARAMPGHDGAPTGQPSSQPNAEANAPAGRGRPLDRDFKLDFHPTGIPTTESQTDPENVAPGRRVAATRNIDRDDDGAVDDDGDRPKRGVVRTAAFAAAVLILLGSGWIAWQNRGMLPGMSAIGGVVLARLSSSSSPETFQAAPFVADGDSRDDIDRALQKTALWRVLKRDYAEWYGERLADVERMRSQKADEKTVSKFLADVVVVQRRKTAANALAASPEHLRQMAGAFIGNLKQLAARDAQTCFGFISFGEANAYMLELTKTPTFAEPLQRQLTAIFEAVADGRKAPKFYAATRRTDYDVLTAELTARGWTQDDLLTFSDARRLSSSPPDKVCRMVQDWFTVQLSLKDAELQGRLLAESLKPLVHG